MGMHTRFRGVGSTATATAGWPWRAMERGAARAERRALDLAYGSAMEGSSAPLRGLPDLSSPLSAVATLRSAGRHLVGLVRGSDGAWEIGSESELGGRLVQRGKKGGDRIGPTRCGKGSKIMAIADGGGVPVAVGVTSASPNESTLVEATLSERHNEALPKRLIGNTAYDCDALDERLQQEQASN